MRVLETTKALSSRMGAAPPEGWCWVRCSTIPERSAGVSESSGRVEAPRAREYPGNVTAPRRFLALLPLLAFVSGILDYGPARAPEAGSAIFTLHLLASVAVIYAWFRLDALRRGYRAPLMLHLAMIAVPLAALPFY